METDTKLRARSLGVAQTNQCPVQEKKKWAREREKKKKKLE